MKTKTEMSNSKIFKDKNLGIANPAYRLILISIAFFCFTLPVFTSAQIKLIPLKKEHLKKQLTTTTRVQSLDLPFFDDFSSLTAESHSEPDNSKWIASANVWVNAGMGINPPSINVATLDGLDETFNAYEPEQILLNGFTDSLTSQPITLSPANNSVYLSFFYQWRGNGEAPDPGDFLEVDFLDTANVWQPMLTISGGENPDRTKFIYQAIKVETGAYLHSDFQFRFRRFGRKSGPFDTWNIDYVYLNEDRDATNKFAPDLPIASGLSALFKPYRAVPFEHFLKNKNQDSVQFDVTNLNDIQTAGNYRLTGEFKKYYVDPEEIKTFPKLLVADSGLIKGNQLIPPSTEATTSRITTKIIHLPNVYDQDLFDSLAYKIEIKLTVLVVDANDLGPFPEDLRMNDSISATYTLADYYAYDDGVAEYSVTLNQAGNSAALLFDMVTDQRDTLTAIDVYFPDFGIESNTTVEFYVLDEKLGVPNKILRTFKTSLQRKGLNNFSRILINPIGVQGKFFIGWKEPGTESVKVGLDLSNTNGDKIFVKTGSVWEQNTIVKGSLMIHAIFGEPSVISGIESTKEKSSVYPNPNNGTFFISEHYDQVQITNTLGQSISFQEEDAGNEKRISFSPSAGLYILRLRKGENVETHKIIVK